MKNELEFGTTHPVHGEDLLASSGQLGRASWLSEKLRQDDIFFMQDGALSKLLFKEVLASFVAGLHIATVTLGFSLIERSIAGRLFSVGEESLAKSKSEVLLDVALKNGWLTKVEHVSLNELRSLRNPIIHFRDHFSESRPELRALLSAKTTSEQLEYDARRTLEATIHVLRQTAL